MINFFRDLFGFSIKSHCMKAFEKKLDEVDKLYRSDINQARYNLKERISEAKEKYEDDKEKIADKHITSVMSKIL